MGDINDLIEMDELMEIMDNDTELIRECFTDFIQENPVMLENIGNAISSGDAAGLDAHAHKLKGSLRYLAAGKTAEIAAQLEQKGKSGTLDGATGLFKDLAQACEQLKAVMQTYHG